MKVIDVDIDGQIFKVQESMSFMQQNKLMELIEDFIDFAKLDSIKEEIENETLTLEKFVPVLREGVKLTKFSSALMIFCLTNFVKEPTITEDNLNDPDDPNIANFAVLGQKLVELAFIFIGKRALLKKTPIES